MNYYMVGMQALIALYCISALAEDGVKFLINTRDRLYPLPRKEVVISAVSLVVRLVLTYLIWLTVLWTVSTGGK